MKKGTLLIVLLAMVWSTCFSQEKTKEPKRHKISDKQLKKLTFSFGFKQIHPDPVITNLDLPGSTGKYGADNMCGKIVRVMRYKNITDAVEARYHLPKYILLAMMMEESTGMDLFPNARDDGGIGLIHMQPCVAIEYSLVTFKECDELVCKKHGKALREIIESCKYNRKFVIKYDDRFHPIKNIDAAGRILAYHLQKEPMKGLGPIRSAIKRYAGKYNYKQYFNDVVKNMAYLSNEQTRAEVEAYFNSINAKLTINGKAANYDEYIRISQQQNFNYGLAEYKLLNKYDIVNADGGTSMYQKYINPKKKKLPKLCSPIV